MVAKQDQYLLQIKACNTMDHFDSAGMLSSKGKFAFWYEMDDLIEHFNRNQVKLLPKLHLRNLGRSAHNRGHQYHHNFTARQGEHSHHHYSSNGINYCIDHFLISVVLTLISDMVWDQCHSNSISLYMLVNLIVLNTFR